LTQGQIACFGQSIADCRADRQGAPPDGPRSGGAGPAGGQDRPSR